MPKVAVVGAGVAGVNAALEAAQGGAAVTLFDSATRLPSRRSGWPQVIAGDNPSDVVSEAVLSKGGVSLALGEKVTDVDPDRFKVGGARLSFDSAVVSTGCRPLREQVEGEGKKGVHILDSESGFLGLRESVGNYSSVVVLGSGLGAAAVADRVRCVGAKVTLISRGGLLGGRLGPALSRVVAGAARDLGVGLVESGVEKVAGVGRVEAVMASGRIYPCDGLAVLPALLPSLPGSSLARGRWGGALVDGFTASDRGRLFAAGGCAEVRVGSSSLPVVSEPAASAMGRVAGANSTGRRVASRVVNSYCGELFGVEVCSAGCTLGESLACDLGVVEASREASGAACSLVVERGSSVVRGAQFAGRGARRLAGLLSMAVSAGLDLEQLAYIEWPDRIDISAVTETAREALGERAAGYQSSSLRPG